MCCSAMSNVAELVRTLPGSTGVHRHIVVVTFVLRRHQTNIHIEIQALEGGVRATGLLCLFGISVGLGSVFIYRLYSKLFCSAAAADGAKRRRHVSELGSSVKSAGGHLPDTLNTPDSGVVDVDAAVTPKFDDDDDADDDNDVDTPIVHRSPAAHMPRSFSAVAGLQGLHLRRSSYAGSLDDVLTPLPPDCARHQRQRLRKTLAVADWLARVDVAGAGDDGGESLCDVPLRVDATTADDSCVSRWSSADHGFISGLMTDSAELDASRLAANTRTSAASDDDDVCPRLLPPRAELLDDFPGLDGERYLMRRRSTTGSAEEWRRRRHYSLASDALSESEYEYRESLVSKGFSVDLGEDLDGMMTPPDAKPGAVSTVAGIESLHHALRQIQRDIDDMNQKFDGLRSSTTINTERSSQHSRNSQHSSPAHDSQTADSVIQFSCGDPAEQCEDLNSERQQSDYIWDYRSDLVPEGTGDQFVARRPIVPSASGNFALRRANLPRNYSDLVTEGSIGGTDDGMVDWYIDDDFGGTEDAACDHVPERLEATSQLSLNDLSSPGLSSGPLDLSQNIVSVNHEAGTVYRGDSELPCSRCRHHLVSCSHSDSCRPDANQHCSSHCEARRLSVPNRPCCHNYHSHCLRQSRQHLSECTCCCQGHGNSYCHCCTASTLRPSYESVSLHDCHPPRFDCCNNMPLAETVRTSTPANELMPFDHCNNYRVPSNTSSPFPQRPVGEKLNISQIIDVAASGCSALQQNCTEVLRMWGTSCVREMGCDAHSAVRAVLYAAMLDNHPVLNCCGNLNDCCQRLQTYMDVRHRYLCGWILPDVLMLSNDSVLETLVDCLKTLYDQMEIMSQLTNRCHRDQYLAALHNGSPDMDVKLTEAAKVIVMMAAINAHENFIYGIEVSSPLIVWQTFGRESSQSAEMFFHQHINFVSNATVLGNELDLSFLAYALGLRVQVFQPSHAGQSDCLRHYPDEGADHLPLVRVMRTGDPPRYFVAVA